MKNSPYLDKPIRSRSEAEAMGYKPVPIGIGIPAALVGAAPDLLRACQAMLEDYEGAYGGEEKPTAMRWAQEAIAKATGH